MPSQQMKIRAFAFDTKEVDDTGAFSGYGSVFGTVDSYNEVVAPGAFAESLAEWKSNGRALPTLWQHRTADPIGHWDMESLKEDAEGLYGEGQLWLAESDYARIAHRGMKTRAITGLSIGYYVRDSSIDQRTGIRTLKKLDLVEISIVTNPANDDARVDSVKAIIAHGGLPTLREFEDILRDAGFSKSHAAIIATRGLKPLLDGREPVGDSASDAIKAALRGFRID